MPRGGTKKQKKTKRRQRFAWLYNEELRLVISETMGKAFEKNKENLRRIDQQALSRAIGRHVSPRRQT